MTAFVLCLALGVALVAGGAVAAFASANALKKITAVVLALSGATLTLAALQAPAIAIVAAVAIAFAYAIVAVAVAVRVQEAYGVVETDEIDGADQQDEPRESET